MLESMLLFSNKDISVSPSSSRSKQENRIGRATILLDKSLWEELGERQKGWECYKIMM